MKKTVLQLSIYLRYEENGPAVEHLLPFEENGPAVELLLPARSKCVVERVTLQFVAFNLLATYIQ